MILKIKKRTGKPEDFDSQKISKAINKSLNDLKPHEKTEYNQQDIDSIVAMIVTSLEKDFEDKGKDKIPTVEDVETLVEYFLMDIKAFNLAKSYIIAAEEKRKLREKQQALTTKKIEQDRLKVIKNNGKKEVFDINKLRKVFNRANIGYKSTCKFSDIKKEITSYLIDNINSKDLSQILIKACINQISVENTHWQFVAGRLALFNLYKKAGKNRNLDFKDIYLPQSYKALFDSYIEKGLYYKDFYKFYSEGDIIKAGKEINKKQDLEYNYTTMTMLSKRYLLNPNKVVNELPQEMYMSAALFLAINEPETNRLNIAFELYHAISSQKISLPTPTLMNARTNFTQLSSCFVLNIGDDLREIYHTVENVAQISKAGGGVGVYAGNIRAQGSSIRGVKNASSGVLPWIKVLNDTAVAVDQQGKRAGAVSVTLDVWHKDILLFLDMQTETGDIRSKSFDVFPAVSFPDLFMKRVAENGNWTLFDPKEVEDETGKKLQDFFGADFEEFYKELENKDLRLSKVVLAKDIWKRYLKSTVETGMPYAFFRDTANRLNPNKHAGNVYSSQLCVKGDTKIKIKDSEGEREIEIKDLEQINLNKKVQVLSYNLEQDKEEYQQITDFAMTSPEEEVYEIEDEETGKKVTCTAFHKIFTKNRGYVMAKDLREDDQLKIK